MLSALGLIACWIAPNYAMLLLGRVVQGTGIALTVSCGPALTVSLFDESRRTRALAFYTGITAIGAALGPLIGGLLGAHWGWLAVCALGLARGVLVPCSARGTCVGAIAPHARRFGNSLCARLRCHRCRPAGNVDGRPA